MSADIVSRMRSIHIDPRDMDRLLYEAAAEIERLRLMYKACLDGMETARKLRAGNECPECFGTGIYTAPSAALAEVERLRAQVAALERALNTPELHDFSRGVVTEAQHQRVRWGRTHDAGKTNADWFWLVGYLAGKALSAATTGNTDKALHHTISTAAALANWHAALNGDYNSMRPGIAPPEGGR